RRWREPDSNCWSHLQRGQPYPELARSFFAPSCTGCDRLLPRMPTSNFPHPKLISLVEPHEETWMENLTGKTALVTGSTDGVGRLVARKLGQAGGRVLVHGRDAERGARVVAEIEAAGGTASFLAADLSSLEEVRRLAGAVQATVGRLD